MSSNVMTASAAQDEAPVQAAPKPELNELKEQIQEALNAYKKRQEAIEAIERALSKARKSEAEGLEQSLTSDDSKVIRRISEARIGIEVQSRRLTVAQQSLPGSLETARQGVLQYYQALVAKVDELVASRMNAHQAFFQSRLDIDSLRATLISCGYSIMQSPLVLLAENTPDVINARQCKPRFVWAINALHDGTGFTVQRLQEDVSRLTECESALATETAREYDFDQSAEVLTEAHPVEI